MAGIPGLEALRLALFPVAGASEAQGPFYINISGTVNTIGGGTGGTAVVDETTFTTGGTSLTPIGGVNLGLGAQAAASIATGVVAAPRISPQRIAYAALATPSGGDVMDNANTAVRVNVVAGGAGGGVANITVRGSANTDLHIGYASGAGINVDGGAYLPIQGSVNVGGMVGSVNITQGTLPLPITGSITLGAIATVNLGLGTVNIGNGLTATVWYAGIGADTTNSALRVNVVAGGGGGGVANITVVGTANTQLHVGYASYNNPGINWPVMPNIDGGAWLPVVFASGFFPTVNLGAVATVNLGLGTVNIGNGITGSVTLGAIATVNLGLGTVNIGNTVTVTHSTLPLPVFGQGGSLGVTQITSPWIITGSVNSTPQGVQKVDTAASLVPTQFPINIAASGYNTLMVGPSGAVAPVPKWYGINLISDATVGFNVQSPSGTYITGSLMQLLPGAGFIAQNVIRNPVWITGSGNAASVFMYLTATAHVSGWAQVYFEPS